MYYCSGRLVVLGIGLFLSVFLFYSLRSLVRNKEVIALQVQERTVELQNSEAKIHAIVDNTAEGLITINQSGHIETFNKACEGIFGYKAEEVIGKNVKLLMPDPYHSEHDQYLEHYRTTGQKKVIGRDREVEGKRKDGSVFPLDLSISEVKIGKQTLYSGFVRDITERKKAEDEIIRSNEELERFAYIASHDLQEPLRMVSNFTSLLAEEYGPKLDDNAHKYIKYTIDASVRMQDLISDLLEYSRMGSEETGFSEFDSAAQLDAALENLKEPIEETDATVTFEDMPTLYTNPIRFSRLIQNLIGNGIKYRAGDRKPVIHVGVADRANDYLFSIKDNGIGIQEEYLAQVFIIFKRLHNKSEYAGTGIGLAVCKKIVDSFGGKIWVESQHGEGSTFYFTVPKKEEQRSAA